jgi:hypothetical protein
MNKLSETTFFVATLCGTSSEALPRSELIQRLTTNQIRWSQLIWSMEEQCWKQAREFQFKGLVGVPRVVWKPSEAAETGAAIGEETATFPMENSSRSVAGEGCPDESSHGGSAPENSLPIPSAESEMVTPVPVQRMAVALDECAEARQIALWKVVKSMIFRPGSSMDQSVTLQDEKEIKTLLKLPQPMWIRGTLQLETPAGKAIQLHVQGRCGADGRTFLMDQVVEVPVGARSVTVFSVVAPKGLFSFTGTCQGGASDQPVVGNLSLFSDV